MPSNPDQSNDAEQPQGSESTETPTKFGKNRQAVPVAASPEVIAAAVSKSVSSVLNQTIKKLTPTFEKSELDELTGIAASLFFGFGNHAVSWLRPCCCG